MRIQLADINYKAMPNWTIESQLKKIEEEFIEVYDAIVVQDATNIVREALDLMQTCATLINMTTERWDMDLNIMLMEHNEKLYRKGYLSDGPYVEGRV